MALTPILSSFADKFGLDKSDVAGVGMRFLSLQVNNTNWEEVYSHATMGIGGKMLAEFKFGCKKGVIDSYSHAEKSHKFTADFWSSLFAGANISEKLKRDSDLEHKLAAYRTFCKEVVDPVSKNIPEEKKLMLFFAINTKRKNLREMIYGENLGLNIEKVAQDKLYGYISEYEMVDDEAGTLAKEYGVLINNLILPSLDGINLSIMKKKSGSRIKNRSRDEIIRERLEKSREMSADSVAYSVKSSIPSEWDSTKEREIATNPIVTSYKSMIGVRFAPPRQLASQIILHVVSGDPNTWKAFPLQNGKVSKAKSLRDEGMSGLVKDSTHWKNLVKMVEYCETDGAARTPQVQTFYKHLCSALPQAELSAWTTNELIQKFITTNLPNWESHWESIWGLDQKTRRAVKQYKSEVGNDPFSSPIETEAFAKALQLY